MGMGTLEPVRTSLGEPLIKFSEISPVVFFFFTLIASNGRGGVVYTIEMNK